jgi:hypothetical protein
VGITGGKSKAANQKSKKLFDFKQLHSYQKPTSHSLTKHLFGPIFKYIGRCLVKLIHDFGEFLERVGRVMFDDFDHLDIVPDSVVGIFGSNRTEELKEFCKKNPQYHIVTAIKFAYYNTFIENSHVYFLGCNDPDPELIYTEKRSASYYNELEILKFDRDERSA